MYQRLLVAMDGSKTADRALDEAIRLARQCQASLRIVHVIDEVSLSWKSGYTSLGEFQQRHRESGQKILDKAADTAHRAGVAAEARLLALDRLTLHVADMIAAEAEAWPADAIVIGSHGRRGVRRMLLGSVAESVARIASKPVVLIRGE
jgi:nucleotide-binding universal stress UspA family protein